MARTPVVMPKMSMTMTEGEVVELLVTVGQKVSQGDVIAVVGTDKTNMEVESDFEGTVLEITSKPGDVIDVGAPMFILETVGEDLLADLFGPTETVTETAAPVAEPVAPIATPVVETQTGIPLAMPGARQLADQLGVDLATVTPQSPSGVIKQSDLGNSPRVQKAQVAVAKAVTTSLSVPQFSISKVLTLSGSLPANATERLAKITDAWVKTLGRHAKLNSFFANDEIAQFTQVRIAFLTKTPLGFVSPVVSANQADTASLESVLGKARTNQIALENLSGATTSITDLLGYGVESASLLLLPPQTTALTLASYKEEAGSHKLTVSLSVDHRVADPGDAAEALATFEKLLETI